MAKYPSAKNAGKSSGGGPTAGKGGRQTPLAALSPPGQWQGWQWAMAAAAALLAAFIAYAPAFNGPFVLDDLYQYFGRPDAGRLGFTSWVASVRPLLNATFWLNYQISGRDTSSYHYVNVILHTITSLVVLALARGLWRRAGGVGEAAPLFVSALFLLHPLQVESVAYVSSRSETLSVLFAYAALAVQLGSKETALSLPRIAAMLVCLGSAVLTKEHTAAMPAIFLLTDYFWRGGWSGIKTNWKLHAAMAAAGTAGLVFVARVLRTSNSAGFSVAGLTPATYLFTQFRMFWRYIRLLVLPAGLNVDPDIAVSQSIFDSGAIFGAAGIVALLVGAWLLRRRGPLASFGLLTFVVLLAPTSSFVPILDVFAERRVYLPFLGVCCIVLEVLRRWKAPAAALAAVLALLAYATWQRSAVWASEEALWTDAVAGSPNKYRPRFQLAYAKYVGGKCAEASTEFERAAGLGKYDVTLLVDWALALDCEGKQAEALGKLNQAAVMENSAHVQSLIGMMHGKMNQPEQALAALDAAQRLNPNFAMLYVYRGSVFLLQGRREEAEGQYRHALALDPGNTSAIQGLASLRR